MKAIISMVTLWSLFIGHCSAESSVATDLNSKEVIDSLAPFVTGSLAEVLSGQNRVLEETPSSVYLSQEGKLTILDSKRKVSRSPAVIPTISEEAEGSKASEVTSK